jgi:thiol:disulfide interchange protein
VAVGVVEQSPSAASLARAIQLSLAPVFVLAMTWLIVGLVIFLVEVQFAIRQNPRRCY